MSRECPHCGGGEWRVFALAQPILAIACQGCGGVEWVAFLPSEWDEYVIPVFGNGTHGSYERQ